jgi:hypothetical protein
MTPWIKFLHVIVLIQHSGDSTILQISSSVRASPFANLFALADASLIFLQVTATWLPWIQKIVFNATGNAIAIADAPRIHYFLQNKGAPCILDG